MPKNVKYIACTFFIEDHAPHDDQHARAYRKWETEIQITFDCSSSSTTASGTLTGITVYYPLLKIHNVLLKPPFLYNTFQKTLHFINDFQEEREKDAINGCLK